MARKRTSRRKQSATLRARTNALRAVKRREQKGVQIPESIKEQIRNMNIWQLRKLSGSRYRELDLQIKNINESSNSTVDDRYNFLVSQKIISPTTAEEEEFYKSVIKYSLESSYGELSESAKQGHGYQASLAKEALALSAKSPEAFNTVFNKTSTPEPPTDKNTIETSTLVYDSVMQRIDEAYSTGSGAEQFLAVQLEKMIQEEIEQYGYDKVIQGMQYADGDLLERVDGYLYDSDQWVNDAWKGSLLAMAQLIHGYIDDSTIEQMSALAELIEGFGEV